MAYKCEMLAASMNPCGVPLYTLLLTYPRCMHAEALTHRTQSRSSASSRAIPTARMISMLEADPYYPIRWGRNQAGMQAKDESLDQYDEAQARAIWNNMMRTCIDGVQRLNELGLHKQWANRPLEWFSWITVVLSATDFSNFLALRDHPAAMPEFQFVAHNIKELIASTEPRQLKAGEWHMPFIDDYDALIAAGYEHNDIVKISAGRCARVSYLNHDNVRAPKDDIALAERLAGQVPGHWSPFEHVAMAQNTRDRNRNFRGFTQLRAILEQSSVEV
jgi:thymidylate synthase ThyX